MERSERREVGALMHTWQLKFLIISCLISIGIFFYESDRNILVVSNDNDILSGYIDNPQYEILSSTECKGDLATYSNIINTMLSDGWTKVLDETDDTVFDIGLQKDNVICRVIKSDGIITSIAKPYAKSYLPITYIERDSNG